MSFRVWGVKKKTVGTNGQREREGGGWYIILLETKSGNKSGATEGREFMDDAMLRRPLQKKKLSVKKTGGRQTLHARSTMTSIVSAERGG
jgi:hypothetical protein